MHSLSQWEYGYKAHFSCDTETSLILKYSFATAKEHDSLHFKDLIDSISQSTYSSWQCLWFWRDLQHYLWKNKHNSE